MSNSVFLSPTSPRVHHAHRGLNGQIGCRSLQLCKQPESRSSRNLPQYESHHWSPVEIEAAGSQSETSQPTHFYHRLDRAICYFHEAWVVAKNSFIELRCLLEDTVPFYLGFTVYTTIYLAHSRHPSPLNNL